MELAAIVGLAIVLFVSTNLDDLFVLLGFFLDPATRLRDVILGQYLGIGALVLLSIGASVLSLAVAPAYVGWLGLLPIAIGIRQLVLRHRAGEQDDDDIPAGGRLLAVAGITVANGGDNLGVYTPVFATRAPEEILTIVIVFAVLIALLILGAHWLVKHPRLGAPIRRYGPALSPWVLIAIGAFVIHDSLA
jgi:cadmium resistance protein CadD (predicted permease)